VFKTDDKTHETSKIKAIVLLKKSYENYFDAFEKLMDDEYKNVQALAKFREEHVTDFAMWWFQFIRNASKQTLATDDNYDSGDQLLNKVVFLYAKKDDPPTPPSLEAVVGEVFAGGTGLIAGEDEESPFVNAWLSTLLGDEYIEGQMNSAATILEGALTWVNFDLFEKVKLARRTELLGDDPPPQPETKQYRTLMNVNENRMKEGIVTYFQNGAKPATLSIVSDSPLFIQSNGGA
jgi:hypothetical protein